MGVPVIAYAATAVPATMDGGGVLVTDKDPVHVAALIHQVVTRPRSPGSDRLFAGRRARRLVAQRLRRHAAAFVDQVMRSPRRPHPPVAFDFWDQVTLAEELEEIRVYRPAAFQALPKDGRA